MSKLVPIFTFDIDDTDGEEYTLRDLLDDISFHIANCKVEPEEVAVNLNIVEYEDDGFSDIAIPEFNLMVKK